MKHSAALKMGLMGALISLGVFAADDSRTKDMNKGKADAAFVEEAAMASQAEIKMSELAVTQSTNASVKELAQKLIDDHTKASESLKEIATNKGILLPFQSVGSSGTTGSTGSTGGTGASGTGEIGTGASGSGASGTGSSDTTGSPKVGDVPPSEGGVSDPAAAGEGRMGASDPMPVDAKNVYGQLSSAAQKKYDDLAKLSGEKFDKQYLSSVVDAHKKSIKLFEKESKSGKDAELKTFATNTLPTLKMHLDMAQSLERELKSSKTPSM